MSTFGFADDQSDGAQFVQAKDKVLDSLKDFFRPEFLNRLDEIVTFDLLTQDVIRGIVKIQVQDVIERLANKEIKLSLTKEVYEYLAQAGYDPKFGARPLKRVIQSKILTPVANMMVGEGMLQGGTVNVSVKKGKTTAGEVENILASELVFDIKKKGRTNLKKPAAKRTSVPSKTAVLA
jgi:ATP-dependent Clp protease ATP-binding subunit ClpA